MTIHSTVQHKQQQQIPTVYIKLTRTSHGDDSFDCTTYATIITTSSTKVQYIPIKRFYGMKYESKMSPDSCYEDPCQIMRKKLSGLPRHVLRSGQCRCRFKFQLVRIIIPKSNHHIFIRPRTASSSSITIDLYMFKKYGWWALLLILQN